MKRLIKASIMKKSYYGNEPDPPVYYEPACIDEIEIDEKWLTEAIEYYQNIIRKYPDLSGDEICDLLNNDLLNDNNYFYFEPKNNNLYSIDTDIDNTGILITGHGYGEEEIPLGSDNERGEYFYDIVKVYINLEAKYSIEEFMQETPQGIIRDLYESMTYEAF